jgi:hypothetical protein
MTEGLSEPELARIRALNRIRQIVNISDEAWASYSDSQREYFCKTLDNQIRAIRESEGDDS